MKEVKLYQVLLFVFGVILILGTITFSIGDKGWNLGGIQLQFLTSEKLFHPKKQQLADISTTIAAIDTSMIEEDPLIKHKNGSDGTMGAPSGGKLSINNSTSIHLNDAALRSLHQFFSKLKAAAGEKKKIHILHYGDSQIEGDRMTGFMRQRIQNQFGGFGPGLIPATNVYATLAFEQEYSENFRRYTCFGGDALKNRKYGVMGSAARFTPEPSDTVDLKTLSDKKEAWIKIKASPRAHSRSRSFNSVKLFYNSCVTPCLLTVYEGDKIIHQDSLLMDGAQHTLKLTFSGTPGALKYVFSSAVSPTICGFSLEGDFGVQMSNIGMRGSSGTIFGKMNQGITGQMMNELNTELVIMQFGGNSVPSFKDSSSVRNFVSYFKSQLNTLKKLRPSAAIVVIGPSDMSMLNEGIYETYPLLPYCVEQMKKSCLAAGTGYWDLYSAMGGKNSMPAWVDKGLAGKDYIHFSNGGANMAAQLFYDALIAEYVKWEEGGVLP